MKRVVAFSVMTLLVVSLLTACSSKTMVGDVEVDYKNAPYDKAELEEMRELVFLDFDQNYVGCTLLTFTYDKSGSKGWEEQYPEAESIAVFKSNFTTTAESADYGFNPDSEYTDWAWVLAKDSESGQWSIVNHGLG